MPEDTKNTGVIISFPTPTDFVAGAETGIARKDVLPTSDWRPYKPKGRTQFITSPGVGFETFYCVTYSALNIIKAEIKRMFLAGEIPAESVALLQQWGFMDAEGNFNASEEYTGKMSGTTKIGNRLTAVWDSIRHDGLVPEAMLNRRNAKNWEEYNAEIPQSVKDFGKKILTIFEFQYEWVVVGNCGSPDLQLIKTELKRSPLQTARAACPRDNQGVTQKCGACATQHATVIYAVDDFIEEFDSYEPFDKKMALNFTEPFLMRGIAILRAPEPQPVPVQHVFLKNMKQGDNNLEVAFLQDRLRVEKDRSGKPYFPVSVALTIETGRGRYGNITRTAVANYQKDNGVFPKYPGRFCYEITRALLNKPQGV